MTFVLYRIERSRVSRRLVLRTVNVAAQFFRWCTFTLSVPHFFVHAFHVQSTRYNVYMGSLEKSCIR